MDIQKEKGRYFIEDEGKLAAEMTYSSAGETMIIIDHTQVNDDYRGLGLGKKLVLEAVEDARKTNIKIIPLCPFAKSLFDRTPEIRDVLKD